MLFLLLPSRDTQKQLRGGLGELVGSHPKHTLSQSEPAASYFGESCVGDVAVNPKSRVLGPEKSAGKAHNQSRSPAHTHRPSRRLRPSRPTALPTPPHPLTPSRCRHPTGKVHDKARSFWKGRRRGGKKKKKYKKMKTKPNKQKKGSKVEEKKRRGEKKPRVCRGSRAGRLRCGRAGPCPPSRREPRPPRCGVK